MKKFSSLIMIFTAVLLVGCGVDTDSATRALKAQGMKDIRITGYSYFGCGKDDNYRSSFTATGIDGSKVSGTVCQGLFKGTTIRYD